MKKQFKKSYFFHKFYEIQFITTVSEYVGNFYEYVYKKDWVSQYA